MADTVRGRIKIIRHDGLYAFVEELDDATGLLTKRAYFFHQADLADGATLEEFASGDLVEFEIVTPQPAKGPRAMNVRFPAPPAEAEAV